MELMHLMHQLKMEYLIANLDALCEQAAKQELDYRSFLAEALATGALRDGDQPNAADAGRERDGDQPVELAGRSAAALGHDHRVGHRAAHAPLYPDAVQLFKQGTEGTEGWWLSMLPPAQD